MTFSSSDVFLAQVSDFLRQVLMLRLNPFVFQVRVVRSYSFVRVTVVD